MRHTYIYALHDPRDWAIRYVGKADDPSYRLKVHIRKPLNIEMRKLIIELAKLGLTLKVSILQKCVFGHWQSWEKFWIATVRASGAELFNLRDGGGGAPLEGPNTERKFSREVRENMSRARIGSKRVPFSEEHRKRISLSKLGLKRSPESCLKQSETMRGKKLSVEHRLAIGKGLRGRKLSPEHAEKLHAACRGKPLSLEHREKVSLALLGKPKPQGFGTKIAIANLRRKQAK